MANYYHRSRPRLTYRDDLSPVEADLLLASIASLEAAYLDAELHSANHAFLPLNAEAADAIDEQSLDYFNRYVAGDRR